MLEHTKEVDEVGRARKERLPVATRISFLLKQPTALNHASGCERALTHATLRDTHTHSSTVFHSVSLAMYSNLLLTFDSWIVVVSVDVYCATWCPEAHGKKTHGPRTKE